MPSCYLKDVFLCHLWQECLCASFLLLEAPTQPITLFILTHSYSHWWPFQIFSFFILFLTAVHSYTKQTPVAFNITLHYTSCCSYYHHHHSCHRHHHHHPYIPYMNFLTQSWHLKQLNYSWAEYLFKNCTFVHYMANYNSHCFQTASGWLEMLR